MLANGAGVLFLYADKNRFWITSCYVCSYFMYESRLYRLWRLQVTGYQALEWSSGLFNRLRRFASPLPSLPFCLSVTILSLEGDQWRPQQEDMVFERLLRAWRGRVFVMGIFQPGHEKPGTP